MPELSLEFFEYQVQFKGPIFEFRIIKKEEERPNKKIKRGGRDH
jgi:hypothetical protein